MLWAKIRSLAIGLFRRRKVESGIAEEIQFHIEARTKELIGSGFNRDHARRQARLEFGSVEKYKEEIRGARGLRLFDELRGDLSHGLRSLRRTPGFTLVAT